MLASSKNKILKKKTNSRLSPFPPEFRGAPIYFQIQFTLQESRFQNHLPRPDITRPGCARARLKAFPLTNSPRESSSSPPAHSNYFSNSRTPLNPLVRALLFLSAPAPQTRQSTRAYTPFLLQTPPPLPRAPDPGDDVDAPGACACHEPPAARGRRDALAEFYGARREDG